MTTERFAGGGDIVAHRLHMQGDEAAVSSIRLGGSPAR